jgi:hypothetical protein
MATTRPPSSTTPESKGGITAQRRLRIVDEDGVKRFIGVRLTVASPERLLDALDTLADWVRVAKQDAAEARATGRWDAVHEVEVVSGEQALRLDPMQFAQFVDDLRSHR